MIRWFLDRFEDPDYQRLLRLLQSPMRRMLGNRSRDTMALTSWLLLLAQPRLIALAARVATRSPATVSTVGRAPSRVHADPLED